MVLLQIAEPGAVVEQQRERQIGVGIDLGTTNSLIAHFDGTQLRVMADESGETSLPSVVYYGVDETLVGRSAMAATQSGADPIASAKRRQLRRDHQIGSVCGGAAAGRQQLGAVTAQVPHPGIDLGQGDAH